MTCNTPSRWTVLLMRSTVGKNWALVGAGILLLAGHPHAQASQSFQDVRLSVKTGDTIVVTDASGQRSRGQLQRLLEDSLEINLEASIDMHHAPIAMKRLTVDEISRIEVESADSIWNGVLIGAAIGASPYLTFAGLRATGSDPPTMGQIIGPGVFFGAVGALIGGLVDRSIPTRRTVFRKEPGNASRIRISLYYSKATRAGRVDLLFTR
jgi:hypothetical protein